MEKLLLILKLLPAIIAAVKAIEEAIPAAGKGAEKLQAVRDILQAVDEAAVTLWPQISAVIARLVELFNATGVFVKKAA